MKMAEQQDKRGLEKGSIVITLTLSPELPTLGLLCERDGIYSLLFKSLLLPEPES